MAIWQFCCNVINRNKNCDMNHGEFNFSWDEHDLNVKSLSEIKHFLKPQKSWSLDIKQYGADESHCLQLMYNGEKIEDISLRLDLRDLSKEIIEAILQFVKSSNGILLHDDKIIEPDRDALFHELRNSNSYKFISNPKSYFENIERRNQ
ncbi:MAG: hypothetical protein K0S34_1947 [Bacillales bacterium]|jgi:hypothetical protein|nr:hypothetical protein [Bacillales bacterium]